MRKRLIAYLAIAALLGGMVTPVSTAYAAGDFQPPGGATIAVEVHLPGFQTPSEVWQDPCDDEEVFTEFYSRRDDRRYKNETHEFLDTELPVPGTPGDGVRERYAMYDGSTVEWVDLSEWTTTVKTHVHWLTGCRDPASGDASAAHSNSFWVPLVTQETVVPALYQRLEEYLQPPRLEWPSMDREFGWLYVKAPMDFRVAPPNAVILTATVTNVTGSVTGSITATPTAVTYSPGEPGGSSVTCSLEAATAGYSIETPGACSYAYHNSSAIAAAGEFPWRTILRWDVTTSSATFTAASIPTVAYGSVAVAEAQAVVTG